MVDLLQDKSLLDDNNCVGVEFVSCWKQEDIVELYRAGGWWREYMDSSRINDLIQGSFLFAVAVEKRSGKAVGMGRVISDGVSDGYIQDLVVLPGWRSEGVGRMILDRLLEECRSRGIAWVSLIAEPGKEAFYDSFGFRRMEGHVPMHLDWEGGRC
ncbi:GNAT family N-acetyltransferase [Methanothrix sp.]|uniref:GNAT family N-acetyltransferase n=1 Tax=Methanothrix sp. TaxID=90426 RepID=UPI003BB18E81